MNNYEAAWKALRTIIMVRPKWSTAELNHYIIALEVEYGINEYLQLVKRPTRQLNKERTDG